jgi:hypothetical protein
MYSISCYKEPLNFENTLYTPQHEEMTTKSKSAWGLNSLALFHHIVENYYQGALTLKSSHPAK